MNTRIAWGVLITLTILIVVLAVALFVVPTPASAPTVDSERSAPASPNPVTKTPTPTGLAPLHTKVSVTSPKAGSTVGKTFVVAGSAPGNWFFEASFPIQVRDKDNNKIGQAIAQAQGEWMTTDQVTFTSSITISSGYSGPATLVLLRDNPSGLPENDDALEVPIVIQ